MKVCFPPRAFSPVGPEVEVTQHMFALELMARRLTLTATGSPSSVQVWDSKKFRREKLTDSALANVTVLNSRVLLD